MGKKWKQWQVFSWAAESLWTVISAIKSKGTPWKNSYDRPRQHSKKQRHHFANRGLIVKAMIFPVVIYQCESWTIKKAEGWRIDAFKLWCWRRLLRVLWTVRTSNHSILKEINPEYSLEWLMLKLKGAIEDEKVGWHQGLNGHEFEDTLGDS